MASPDKDEFIAVAYTEIRVLEDNATWDEVLFAEVLEPLLQGSGAFVGSKLLMACFYHDRSRNDEL